MDQPRRRPMLDEGVRGLHHDREVRGLEEVIDLGDRCRTDGRGSGNAVLRGELMHPPLVKQRLEYRPHWLRKEELLLQETTVALDEYCDPVRQREEDRSGAVLRADPGAKAEQQGKRFLL